MSLLMNADRVSMTATKVYKLYGKPENLLWYRRRGYNLHHHYDVKKLVNVIKYIRGDAELDESFYKLCLRHRS